MSVEVTVAIPNLRDMVERLDVFREDQLPFALSVGMNRAAKDARDGVRPLMERVFDLKSKNLDRTIGPFGSFGRRTSDGWSSKKQWPELRVVFGSLAHAMELQESGGNKPRRAPKVWIPTKYVERAASGRKRFRHRKSTLIARMEDPRGAYAVFTRRGIVFERHRRTGEVRPLYLLRERAQVPQRLGLEGLVRDTYNAKLFPRFSEAMAKALANPKATKG